MICVLSCLAFAAHLKFKFQTVKSCACVFFGVGFEAYFFEKTKLGHDNHEGSSFHQRTVVVSCLHVFQVPVGAFLRVIQELELI